MTKTQARLNELHGGEVEWAVSEKYDIPITQIVSFASTVSPIIPKSILSLGRKLDQLYLYPARDHAKLKEAIAKHEGIDDTSEIILGCGSTEIIHIFAQMISGGEAIIPAPTYGEYETAVTKYGGKTVFAGIGEDFNLDIDAVEEAVSPRTKAIFVCNPNNPTGRLYQRSDLLELARIAREREFVLIVDEAYLAFAPESKRYSMASLTGSYPVLVLNSLSKLFGVPSLRLGWGIASPMITKRLERFKIPWTISNPAIWAGEELLYDVAHERRIKRLIASQKSELVTQFKGMSWLKVWPSDCNFLLLQILDEHITAPDVFESLVKKGIVVRDCSSIRGLGDRFLRVTVRTPINNRALISSLKQVAMTIPTLRS